MQNIQNRRSFLAGAAAASSAGLFARASSVSAEPAPETTKVRLPRWIGGGYCWAGAYIADELLRAEGFTVYYFQGDPKVDQPQWIAQGKTAFSINSPPMHITSIEAGVPIKVLEGLHSGCLELVANDGIRSVADLKGKRVGVWLPGVEKAHVSIMAAYVGLDPEHDIQWVHREGSATELFVQGKIDAFLTAPPHGQRARAEKIGHVILDTAVDSPWAQHFCCMISATSNYVSKYPVATKRVLRAILKSRCVRKCHPGACPSPIPGCVA